MTLANQMAAAYNNGIHGDAPALYFLNTKTNEYDFDHQKHTATFTDGSKVYVICNIMEEIKNA